MKIRKRFLTRCLLSLLPLVFFQGCPKTAPVKVAMILAAAPNVNPDPNGQALSVVVRLYQLKDKGRLETADYNSIWKSDRDTLSDDFLSVQERVVQPGSQDTIEIQANPMATYLGVVALFRSPSGNGWRKIIPMSGKSQKINLTLREQSIEVISAGK